MRRKSERSSSGFWSRKPKINPFLTLFHSAKTAISWFYLTALGLLYIVLGKVQQKWPVPWYSSNSWPSGSVRVFKPPMFSAVVSVSLALLIFCPNPYWMGILLLFFMKKFGQTFGTRKSRLVYFIGIVCDFFL
jgi:hypothetical protein